MGAYGSKILGFQPDASIDESEALFVPIETSLGASIPTYATKGAAGVDLRAVEAVELCNKQTKVVETGISMALPFHFHGQIVGRADLAMQNIHVHPDVIDQDYRGTIKVLMTHVNHTHTSVSAFKIAAGDPIAQLLILPFARPVFKSVEELSDTPRGSDGFESRMDIPIAEVVP